MINEKIINILKKDANIALKNGEIPISAVIFDSNGNIVSHACNSRQKKYSVINHAEILAILKAERKIKDWRLDGYSMVVSMEPCLMCSNIIKESRIDKVYYYLDNRNLKDLIKINKEKIVDQKLCVYFSDLIDAFFNNKR